MNHNYYDLNDPNYTPQRLFESVARRLRVKTDQALALALGFDPATLSCVKCRKHHLSPIFVLRIMEVCDMTFDEIKSLSGVRSWIPPVKASTAARRAELPCVKRQLKRERDVARAKQNNRLPEPLLAALLK